jgi:hypothetical protein
VTSVPKCFLEVLQISTALASSAFLFLLCLPRLPSFLLLLEEFGPTVLACDERTKILFKPVHALSLKALVAHMRGVCSHSVTRFRGFALL